MKAVVFQIDIRVEAQHAPPAIASTFSTVEILAGEGRGIALSGVMQLGWAGTCSPPSVISTRRKCIRKTLEATLVKSGWG